MSSDKLRAWALAFKHHGTIEICFAYTDAPEKLYLFDVWSITPDRKTGPASRARLLEVAGLAMDRMEEHTLATGVHLAWTAIRRRRNAEVLGSYRILLDPTEAP